MLAKLPTVNSAIRPSSRVRRAIRAVIEAISGAPTTTPRA